MNHHPPLRGTGDRPPEGRLQKKTNLYAPTAHYKNVAKRHLRSILNSQISIFSCKSKKQDATMKAKNRLTSDRLTSDRLTSDVFASM